ncbi:MAG: DUF1080 domain-containing protein [Verrucomicrobiales bacterium]|nr:DUF1080 domain-containing protein [Verrucomicrobiales bacterium]
MSSVPLLVGLRLDLIDWAWHEGGMHSRLPGLWLVLVIAVSSFLGSGCATSPQASPSPSVSQSTNGSVQPKPASAPATAPTPPAVPASTAAAPPKASSKVPFGDREIFDGRTLTGWKLTEFAGAAEVRVEPNFRGGGPAIILEQGVMTGITWTNDLPRMNYEITLEAMRVAGSDFFCGLTFPVGKDPCSLIVGGWGGSVLGLSSIDSEDAAHNETAKYLKFEEGRWYRIRLRVTEGLIQAWLDDEQVVNLVTTDRTISVRIEVEMSMPLGFSTWSTTGALRKIRLRSLDK